MDTVRDNVAFITGGGSGIGLGIAHELSRAGAKVVIAGRDRRRLEMAASQICDTGGRAMAVELDVTNREAWAAVVPHVEEAFGTVQILVNNAGVSTLGVRIADVTPGMWDAVLSTNLTGTYNGVHFFLEGMRQAGGGHIVNTASMGGLLGLPALAPYVASKFGVVGLSEALREELAPEGIGVSVLCPGGVRSELWRTSLSVRGLPDSETPPPGVNAQSAFATMQPDEVGRAVVRGIVANDLYILTHPEFAERVEARADALTAAFRELRDRPA